MPRAACPHAYPGKRPYVRTEAPDEAKPRPSAQQAVVGITLSFSFRHICLGLVGGCFFQFPALPGAVLLRTAEGPRLFDDGVLEIIIS